VARLRDRVNEETERVSPKLREVVVAIEQMIALGSGWLFIGFFVLVFGLAAYAIYFMFFRIGK